MSPTSARKSTFIFCAWARAYSKPSGDAIGRPVRKWRAERYGFDMRPEYSLNGSPRASSIVRCESPTTMKRHAPLYDGMVKRSDSFSDANETPASGGFASACARDSDSAAADAAPNLNMSLLVICMTRLLSLHRNPPAAGRMPAIHVVPCL